MSFKKDFFVDCVGAVTILVSDRVIFQGQIVKDDGPRKHHDESHCEHHCPKVEVEVKAELDNDPNFIVLRLTCDPALLRDNATIEEIEPDLFEEGDIIRINVNDIVAVGPSRECFEEDKSAPSYFQPQE